MSGRISEAHHSAAITRVLEIVPYAAAIREHVSEIVASPAFKGSRRGQEFLRHIIEKALKGQFDDLKERTLGVELFGRPPAYDTAEDAVVRVTACDVRKRLTHFYGEAESSFEVRIELPSGSYIPEFRRIAGVISEVEIVRPVAPKAALGKAASLPYRYWFLYRYRFLWAAMALTLVFWLVLSGGLSFKPLAKRILPWSELLQGDRGVQLVLSDPDIATVQDILATNLSLSDYANHRYLPEHSLSPDMQLALRGYRGDNAATVDTIIALNIADLARPATQRVRIHPARSMKLPDFKVDDHFILLGSPRSNPWATLFEEQLDFVFEYDQVSNQEIIRNKRPAKGEPPSYIPTAKGGGTGQAYAIVGFAANPGQSGDALLLAGSNAEATEAAGRIATNLKALEATLRNCGIDSLKASRHFELLLRVTTMAGSPNRFDVIVCHALPGQQK